MIVVVSHRFHRTISLWTIFFDSKTLSQNLILVLKSLGFKQVALSLKFNQMTLISFFL